MKFYDETLLNLLHLFVAIGCADLCNCNLGDKFLHSFVRSVSLLEFILGIVTHN
uniref:Uncharacterized protein n=1 Tax=Arundo donax TaxID=35708 RepID=A0A0A9F720_ARUDO